MPCLILPFTRLACRGADRDSANAPAVAAVKAVDTPLVFSTDPRVRSADSPVPAYYALVGCMPATGGRPVYEIAC